MNDAVLAAAGPLRQATMIVADAAAVAEAYAVLGLAVTARQTIGAAQARAWGHADLAGHPMLGLAAGAAENPALLRLIEIPGTPPRLTRFSHGWMALEILVRDVDALALRLSGSRFEIIGEPADLDVSANIRAMQCVGPAGEMLYLTQVKAPVPPFAIPLSAGLAPAQHLGPLFIAVMSTASRSTALQACAALAPRQTLQFDTKVSVLNRALGRALDSRWPVATVQLDGQCLFEIDEVVHPALGEAARAGSLPAGLAWIGIDAAGEPGPLIELSPGAWVERLQRPR